MTTGLQDFSGQSFADLSHGVRENIDQFLHQLIQVLLVGFAIGMMRALCASSGRGEI